MPPRRTSSRTAAAAAASAAPAAAPAASSLFAGLTIAVAGKFERTQAELKQIITSNGGSAVSSLTKSCTHFLADAQLLDSAKAAKAVAAGVAVVTEEWLVQSAANGKISTDPKLLLSQPAAAPKGEEQSAAAAAAPAATQKRKRGADDEEAADAADAAADEADDAAGADDGNGASAAAAAAAAPAAKKQKGAAAAAAPAAAAALAAAPAPTSFAGKKFIVMGGFAAGKFKVESAVSNHGGEVTTSVLKSLDYCVYGTPVSTDYGGVSGPGSKKYKECRKMKRVTMLSEDEFFKLVAAMEAAKTAAAGAAGAGAAGSSSGGGGGSDEAHPIVAEFKSILSLLGAGDTKLQPASLSSITAAEDEMRMAIPPALKALLLHVSDGSQSIDVAGVDLPYFWPSVSDITEQFSYNPYLPIIYRDCKWMPYHMLDYDFCWNVIALPSGRILQVDSECNTCSDLGYTFEGRIVNFKRFLEERKEKEKEKAKNKPADAAAAAAAGAGGEGEGEAAAPAAAASASASSPRVQSLSDEFNDSPLSGKSHSMDYAERNKYWKAYQKAERAHG